MTVETARAFICFEIGQNTRDYLANLIAEGKKAGDRIAWAKPHGIHLTLKFLDNITLQQIEDIETILKEISIEKSEFRITIDRIGAFPNFHTPRVFWVGNSHNSNTIANLVA
ncbi:MAG: RNA 2',3'-cyclic phosphodiesterase, partial [bacterium]